MKILWMSDSPTSPSSYGNITREICAGLARRGHEVAILGFQTTGGVTSWEGCALHPVGRNPLGADALPALLEQLRPDALVTLVDPWRVLYVANARIGLIRRAGRIPWIFWYPLDSDQGEGRLPSPWVDLLRAVDLPAAMSRYGQECARANGVEAACIPMGVDLDLFRPAADRRAAKRALGYDGRFVALADARNADVLLHLHCDPEDPAARAPDYHYNLRADVRFLGLEEQVRFTPGMSAGRGVPPAELAALYQAADVHLLTSYGEGFGMPTLQTAAAGVVPLAPDYSANPELLADHGEPLPVRHFVRGPLRVRLALVDAAAGAAALERLYQDPELRDRKAAAGRQFAAAYAWPEIVDRWDEWLEQEVPRLREGVERRLAPTGGAVGREAGGPGGAADLPADVEAAARELEAAGGLLPAAWLRESARSAADFTLPVTLPPAVPGREERVMGRVYLAGAGDRPAFTLLCPIFPGLSAGSPDAAGAIASVPGTGPDHERFLAGSTLALDVDGVDPELPGRAARLGVPCVARAGADQRRRWPELALPAASARGAALLGRWMLTDQGAAEELCRKAV